MRKITREGIVVAFLDEANRVTSQDSFLLEINKKGVPLCTITGKRGKVTSVSVDEAKKVFPGSSDFVVSLRQHLEANGYRLQLMGDML